MAEKTKVVVCAEEDMLFGGTRDEVVAFQQKTTDELRAALQRICRSRVHARETLEPRAADPRHGLDDRHGQSGPCRRAAAILGGRK